MSDALFIYRLCLTVPLRALQEAGVDTEPFLRWLSLMDKLREGNNLKDLVSRGEVIALQLQEQMGDCFDVLEEWPLYQGIKMPVPAFHLSQEGNPESNELEMEFLLLGTSDQEASRAAVDEIRLSAVAAGCVPCIYECRVAPAWIRPNTCWPEAPKTGYELLANGEWELNSDSEQLGLDDDQPDTCSPGDN